MHKSPLVTIAIPVYNHEAFVGDCIESVIAQTYNPIELIIINDGSTDNSDLIIRDLIPKAKKQLYSVMYRRRENFGLSTTLNECLSLSTGNYFSCVASDDMLAPNKIDLLMCHFSKADDNTAAVFGNAGFIDREGKQIFLDRGGNVSHEVGYKDFLQFYTRNRKPNILGSDFGTYRSLLEGNYLPAMSCVLRTDHIRSVGGWTDGNPLEDFDMWIKLTKSYKFICVREIVAYYRWHDDNTVKQMTDQLARWAAYIYARERKYSFQTGARMSWYKGYYSVVKNIFRIRSITLREKLNILDLNLIDTLFLARFLLLDVFIRLIRIDIYKQRFPRNIL